MSTSRLDAVYRSILLTKFFTKGWGKPENLRRLFEFRKVVSNRDECYKLVERNYPVTITKEQTLTDCKIYEGYFITPLERYLPGIVPEIAQKAHFQALLPLHWPQPGVKPMCLHLAGTGDHRQTIYFWLRRWEESGTIEAHHRALFERATTAAQDAEIVAAHVENPFLKTRESSSNHNFFWRRRNLMVKPLLKEAGIGGIILENPFYGLRKPTDQVRSSLHNVSDIFVMGGCLILESLVLFHWCERNGLGPLGVTGLSMGGHMASLAATNWPKPLVLVPCLSWSTASAVFLQGVMSHSINWDLLEDQYLSDGIYREKLSKMVTIIDEAFLAGKKFARTYSQTVAHCLNEHAESVLKKDEPAAKPETPAAHEQPNINTEHKPLKPQPYDSTVNIVKTKEDIQPIVVKGNEIIDVSRNIIQLDETRKDVVKPEIFGQVEDLNKELKRLLDQRVIPRVLYNKLTSNEKFELDPEDIENINKLNEVTIREVLLRCKVADKVKKDDHPSDKDKNPQPIDPTNTPTGKDKSSPSDEVKMNPEIQATAPTTALATPPEKNIFQKKSWNVVEMTSDLWFNWPFTRGSGKKIDIAKIHWRDREALQFMRGVMDECTHLSNFSIPYDTSLIIAVCAKHDAYVPREDVGTLEEIWPGAEVRYVDAGHVSAYILHQSLFRSCIKEAFERSKKKWKDGKHINEPPNLWRPVS